MLQHNHVNGLSESAHLGILQFDTDMTIAGMNACFSRYTGIRDFHHQKGKRLEDVMEPDFYTNLKEQRDLLNSGEQTEQAVLFSLVLKRDKRAFTHQAELRQTFDTTSGNGDTGRTFLLLLFPGTPAVSDSGLPKQPSAPSSLKEKNPQQLFGELSQFTRVGTWQLDVASGTLTWSDEVYDMFGISKEDEVPNYEAFFNVLPAEDRGYVREAFENHLADDKKYELLHRIIRPDGVIRVVYEQAQTRRHPDGSARLTEGVVLDVTEVLDYLNTANLYDRNLHALFNQIPLALMVFDYEGRLVQLNKQFTALTGYSTDDFSILEEWHTLAYPDPDYRANIREIWQNAIDKVVPAEGDSLPDMDFEVRLRNGEVAFIEFTHIPNTELLIFSLTNTTSRSTRIKQLEEQEEQLNLISRFSTRFINIPLDRVESELSKALKLISKALGVDRSFILGKNKADNGFHFRHTWQRNPEYAWESPHELLHKLGAGAYPDGGSAILLQTFDGRMVQVNDVIEWLNQKKQLKSLIVPLVTEGELLGYLGFEASSISARFFSYELNIPFMLAEIFINNHNRKTQAEALSERERELTYLYKSMADGVVYQNADGYITRANPAAERLLGLTLDQMQGRTSSDPRWHAIQADGSPFPGESHPAMVALKTGKNVENVEMGIFHPEKNKHVWILINARPEFRDGEKPPWQVYTTFTDITALKEQSLRLQQLNDRTEEIGILAQLGFWDVNLETNEARLDAMTRRILGVDATGSDMVPALINLYVEDESRSQSRIRRAVEDCTTNGTPYDLDLKLKTPKGEVKWVRSIGKSLHRGETCIAFWGSVQDITLQKQRVEKLQHQAKLQELFVRIATEFISVLPENTDDLITRSLQNLGEFVGASRFSIYQYDFENQSCRKTHYWDRPGYESEVSPGQLKPLQSFGELPGKHAQGSWVIVSDTSSVPEDDSFWEIPGMEGVKTFMSIPLRQNGGHHGFLALKWIEHPHEQTDDEVGLLTLFASMIENTWSRTALINELDERQQFLTDIFENSGSLITVKDRSGVYHTVNKKWEEVTGLKREQVVGRNDNDLFDPETAEGFIANDNKVMGERITVETEEQLGQGDDARFFISVKFPTFNSKDEVTGLCGIITEITELRKAQQQERQALERTTAVLQANPDLMFVVGVDLRITEYYTKDDDALLYEPTDYVGSSIYKVLPIDIAEDFEKKLMLTHRTQEPQQYSYKLDIHGTTCYYEARLVPYGKLEILIIVRDVTAQKEGERNSRRLDFVVNESLNEIYFFDSNTFNFINANKAALHNLGYKIEELIQLKAWEIKEGFSEEDFQEQLKPLLNGTQQQIQFNARHKRKNGTSYDVLVQVQRFEFEEELLFASFVMDVSQQMRYQNAILKQNKTLRDISWEQSHLVRAPLARLKGLMSLFADKDFEFLSEEKLYEEINKSADEFEQIILDISKKTYIVDEIEKDM